MRLTYRHTLHTHPTTPSTNPPLVELVDLTLTPHLHHLDLTLHPGEHLALVGLSDPTVLTRLLTGHTRPTTGHLHTHHAHIHPLDPTTIQITTTHHHAHIHTTAHPTRSHHADRILYFEHGHLSETGTHRQLLLRGGNYARAYALTGPHRTAT
ncbi:hypothetical protein [Nocardiopsis xinjiangensis]|uniref:hypothetical protein n=1 Tax=Nocardiopsis xinjiangensis TaxID=124285 RepID=UPI00034ACEFA|nr:hypothetical protein [Nocardiopsis xinjiangensis]